MDNEAARMFFGYGSILLDLAIGFAAGWFFRGRKERTTRPQREDDPQ